MGRAAGDRAASDLVSVMLVVGITVVGLGVVGVQGFQEVTDSRRAVADDTAEAQLIELTDRIRLVATTTRDRTTMDVDLQGDGHVTASGRSTRLSVAVGDLPEAGLASRCRPADETPPCPNGTAPVTTYSAPSSAVRYDELTGSIQYFSSFSGTEVRTELGGVFERSATTPPALLYEPTIERRSDAGRDGDTVVLRAYDYAVGAERSLDVAADVRANGTGELLYERGYVEPGEVVRIAVTTQYAGPWASYLAERFPAARTEDPAANLRVEPGPRGAHDRVVLTLVAGDDGLYLDAVEHDVVVSG